MNHADRKPYITRNRDKAVALFVALTDRSVIAGITPVTDGHGIGWMVAHNASVPVFHTARAAIADRYPMNTATTADMPDPNTVTVPDTIPDGWA